MSQRHISRFCTVMALLFLSPTALAVDISEGPAVNARAWLLIDHHSGQRLASKNSDKQFTPNHLSKLMVSYIAFGILESSEESATTHVPVSYKATRAASPKMFVSTTSQISMQNLLKAIIVGRANDATIALAEHIGSDEQAFVSIMNNAAEKLGMGNTHYRDATGHLQQGQFTNANDLSVLVRTIIGEYPQYYSWFNQREFKQNGIALYNRNALLWRDKNVDGLMAIRSQREGHHLIASSRHDNMRLTAIVLGAPSERAMLTAGEELLKFGFENFETRKLYTGNIGAVNLRIWLGDSDILPVGLTNDLYVTLRRGDFENLQAKLNITGTTFAPVPLGQHMGSLSLLLEDKTIGEYELVSLRQINEGGISSRMLDRAEMWLRDIPNEPQSTNVKQE